MTASGYQYVAVDAEGRRTRGRVEAESDHDAFRLVQSRGLTPVSIRPVREKRPLFTPRRVTARDVADLTYELSVLMEAKVPLAQGLLSIADGATKPMLRDMVRDIAALIEAGAPITAALEKYERVFGDVYIQTMRAAERSGDLAGIMTHLAEMLEKQIESRRQLRQAMTYPVIVLSVVAVALGVLIVFVIPRFGETFKAQRIELPAVTRAVQAFGHSVLAWWPAYAGVVVGGAVALAAAWRTQAGRLALERLAGRTPYFGRLISSAAVGRFARVFGLCLRAGLGLIECVEISGRATGLATFTRDSERMVDQLRAGRPLPEALRSGRQIPAFAQRMLVAGRDSSEVAKSCAIVARHYEREAALLTRNVSTVIEPLMTVALAGIVLLIALSVFLPMWQMFSQSR